MTLILNGKKKGVIQDLGTILVFGFMFALAVVIIYIVLKNVETGLQDAGSDMEEGANRFSNFMNLYVPLFDMAFVTLLIGLTMAGMIGLFILDSHPVLFIASAIGLVIILVIAAALANAYSDFAVSEGIAEYESDFTFIPLMMSNFVQTLLVIGGLFAIALYAKIRLR